MDLQSRFDAAFGALSHGPTLVIGVSGGLDSMALLELLQGSGKKLVVAHFNHQLRGDESDGDEAFVRLHAEKRGAQFRVGRGDVRGEAKGISIEMAARKLRHAFLAQVAREFSGDIVLAHHADDQIELVVMRSKRKIQGYGAAGMRADTPSPADRTVRVLRPLLGIRKHELKEFIESRNIPFREDSSNAGLDAERNRVRNVLLPRMRGFRAEFEERLLKNLPDFQFVEDQARSTAKAWLRQDFDGLPCHLKEHVIAIQLEQLQIPVTGARIQTLMNNLGKPVMIRPNVTVTLKSDGRLCVHETPVADPPIQVHLRGLEAQAVSFGGGTLTWDFPYHWRNLQYGPGWFLFDAFKVRDQVVLRHPEPNDRVRLSGRSSARPLMDVLSRNKIPLAQRAGIVVATTDSGEIFWVEGLRITDDFKITDQTAGALLWRWRRD
jgi:tRNA(Ile)-lysidine synthase